MQKKRGFTLIELLVVIGIIAILAAIVVIAVNPGRQFAQARNAQRWSDVNALLNAIHQYAVDNDGAVPPDIVVGTTAQVLGSATTGTPACTAKTPAATYLDLSDELVGTDQKYLTGVPMDPSGGTAGVTKYYVNKATNLGRIEVGACEAELAETISVTR